MVTYSRRQAKPQVRFLAPHPFFIFLSILLLSGSSMAVDQQSEYSDFDHYSSAPDTLASSASSSDSLARVVGGDIFGVYWSSFGGSGQISSIDGISMTGRADGVQELATATYKTFQGVEAAISSSSSSVIPILQRIENSIDTLEGSLANILRQLEKDDNPNFDNLYTRLLALYNQQTELASENRTFWNEFWSQYTNRSIGLVDSRGSNTFNLSVPDLIAGLSRLLYYGSIVNRTPWLNADGHVSSDGPIAVTGVIGRGFVGLATLLAGDDNHRGAWVWLNPSGYEGNGSTSLMDMVGEGFLGLSALFSDTEPGEARLSWMYVSPDDGLTGTQLKHDTLFSFLGSFASGVQNPLARLAYVLADLDDIELKKEEKPNTDAVKDNFFGDGEGSVDPGQIKDLSGMSSGIKDSFAGAGSPGDAFTAINDSQSFWFFSQEVADALDTVNAPALASEEEDDFMDQFVQDDDGYYSLVDLSPWDVGVYLGGS